MAPTYTASYSGWKNDDDASVVSGLTLTSEYLVTSNVGTYDIVPANATAKNYEISYNNGTLTVNQAQLTINADNKSVEYGEEAPAFTASYSGWKNADDASVVSGLTFACEYLVTSNVGTYDIVPANATAQNYSISYNNGTLTVGSADHHRGQQVRRVRRTGSCLHRFVQRLEERRRRFRSQQPDSDEYLCRHLQRRHLRHRSG